MKKLIVFPVLIFLSLFLKAQSNYDILNDKDRIVYWFEMSIKYSEPDDYACIIFVLGETDDLVKAGTAEKFAESVYNALKQNHICIGYYNTKQEAEDAKAMYHLFSNKGEDELKALKYTPEILKSFPDESYFFILAPYQGKNQWYYERKPGALGIGTKEYFFNFVRDNLLNEVLTVGPFIYGETAEDSKRIFRLKNADADKKQIKYPFNFKGTWIAKQGNEKLVLDFKKGFKTKLISTHTNKDSVYIAETEYIDVVHPYVLTYYFSVTSTEYSSKGSFTYCLFLSEDMKSANLKVYNSKSGFVGEYNLVKE